MSRVIVCANQKGGVAKTTTTLNVGIGLARKGMKVLLVDNDSQASLTVALGFQNPNNLKFTTASTFRHMMTGEEFDPEEAILHHEEGVDLLPANTALNTVENELSRHPGGEFLLREYLELLEEDYDFIIIDCSPNLGFLTLNALTAGTEVIIPLKPSYLDMKGLELLIRTILQVRKRMNPGLSIKGILLTMVDARTNHAKDVEAKIREVYGRSIHVFDNKIPHSVKAVESAAVGKSIYEHDPKGTVAAAYGALTWEVMA